MYGLIASAIQQNRAREGARRIAEKAAKKAAFDVLPPAEQSAIKFEDLMSRWPEKSLALLLMPKWLCVLLGYEDYLMARREAWRAELCALCIETDTALFAQCPELESVLIRHSGRLTAELSTLICTQLETLRLPLSQFGNALSKLYQGQ